MKSYRAALQALANSSVVPNTQHLKAWKILMPYVDAFIKHSTRSNESRA